MTQTLDETRSRLATVTQLLDEHHVVVLGDDAPARAQFGQMLAEHLRTMPDTLVTVLPGEDAPNLDAFCRLLEAARDADGPVPREIPSLIRFLRASPSPRKHQYIIWRDADVLLESDIRLFGRVVNALLATAACLEHIDPDVLVLQRVVFLGGDKLGAYAEEPHGQFNAWRTDDEEDLWEVYACLDRPPVLTFRLDG